MTQKRVNIEELIEKIAEQAAEEEDYEGKLFRRFEKYQEFTDLQTTFLYGNPDGPQDEDAILRKISFIVSTEPTFECFP